MTISTSNCTSIKIFFYLANGFCDISHKRFLILAILKGVKICFNGVFPKIVLRETFSRHEPEVEDGVVEVAGRGGRGWHAKRAGLSPSVYSANKLTSHVFKLSFPEPHCFPALLPIRSPSPAAPKKDGRLNKPSR